MNRAELRRTAKAARKPAPSPVTTPEACCLGTCHAAGYSEAIGAAIKVVTLVQPAMNGGGRDAAFCIHCCLDNVDTLASTIDSIDEGGIGSIPEHAVIDLAEAVASAREGIKDNGKPGRKFEKLLDAIGELHNALHELVNFDRSTRDHASHDA
jgi:hypothetical protein